MTVETDHLFPFGKLSDLRVVVLERENACDFLTISGVEVELLDYEAFHVTPDCRDLRCRVVVGAGHRCLEQVSPLCVKDWRFHASTEDQLQAANTLVLLAVYLLVLDTNQADRLLGWEGLEILWTWPLKVSW